MLAANYMIEKTFIRFTFLKLEKKVQSDMLHVICLQKLLLSLFVGGE